MLVTVVLLSIVAGIAAGLLVAIAVTRRQQALQAEATMDAQAAAVEAAVRQVLAERGATAAAVTADREATVAAAVDNAVKVAGATLDAKLAESSKELDLRSASFDERVQSIGNHLERVTTLVGDLQKAKAEQHGQLVSELRSAAARSRELHDTTAALRDVLASPKARGQWGERMAEDVLRAAGFNEGVNYRKQQTSSQGGVPDFTFLLPRGLELNMDVKFPVDNYIRYLEAADDLGRDRARTAFARDVRSRIRELRDRGYIDAERTVDTMLLFIPNESVYAFVHENDADLIDQALKQKVVLCSPLTLFSVLAIVRQAVDNFRLERRSGEILDFLVEFREEWGRFTDHLDKAGKQLDTFSRTFEGLGGTRRNQLERKLRRVDELEAEHEARADLVPLLDEPDADRAGGPALDAGEGEPYLPPAEAS